MSVLFVLWPHSSQTYTTSSRSWEKRTGIAWTGRIPILQRGQSGLAKTMLELTPRWGQHTILHWMSSPICIELKRSPDLQSMHTPPAAEAGLESEKFIECDVGDGRNAGAIGTHANSYQSGCRVLCLPMASCRQPEGAAISQSPFFGSSRKEAAGWHPSYVACRVPSTRAD